MSMTHTPITATQHPDAPRCSWCKANLQSDEHNICRTCAQDQWITFAYKAKADIDDAVAIGGHSGILALKHARTHCEKAVRLLRWITPHMPATEAPDESGDTRFPPEATPSQLNPARGLCIGRREGEKVVVSLEDGRHIVVTIGDRSHNGETHIIVAAPRTIGVDREEIWRSKQESAAALQRDNQDRPPGKTFGRPGTSRHV